MVYPYNIPSANSFTVISPGQKFTFPTFMNNQRIYLRGAEYQLLRNIPKLIYVIVKKLKKIICDIPDRTGAISEKVEWIIYMVSFLKKLNIDLFVYFRFQL